MSVPGGKVPIANIFVVGVVGMGEVCAMATPAEATSTEAAVKIREGVSCNVGHRHVGVNCWCQSTIDFRE
jgi:hypothetical protein